MEPEPVTIDDLANLLSALNEFDPVVISSMVAFHLLIFSIGYITGTVIKIMKKA